MGDAIDEATHFARRSRDLRARLRSPSCLKRHRAQYADMRSPSPNIGGDAPIGITADEWRMLQLTKAHLEAEAAADAAEAAAEAPEAAVEAPVAAEAAAEALFFFRLPRPLP